jgi:SNF2 family DNA or RNA helicase
VLEQRIARAHRLGQRRPVHITLRLAEDSIETRMEATLAAKRTLFEAAVGDSDADTVVRGSLGSRIAKRSMWSAVRAARASAC